jgi:hypothetical protein
MRDVAHEPGEGDNDVSSEGESDDDDEDEDTALSKRAKKLALKEGEEAPELHDNEEDDEDSSEEEESSEAEESSSEDESVIAPSTTAASHRRSLRDPKKLQKIVEGDMARDRQKTERQHHSRKALHSAGKLKGSKWKSSAAIMVGKNGDKSGWS